MKILILTCSAGNGHNSAAKRIQEKFLAENPQTEIEIVDIYKQYASRLQAWIIEDGYFFACNHLMKTYNHFFKKTEHTDFENKHSFGCHSQVNSMLSGILNKIYSYQPDLIVCTYIFSAIAVANLKRVYNIPAKVACMTLDYGVSPYWECTSDALDYMFLTDEYMIEPFVKRGFKESQLFVSGIPISNEFYVERDKAETRKLLGLDENLFTIVVMCASFFPVTPKQLINNLKQLNKKIQVVIINGKNHKQQKKYEKLLKNEKLVHVVHNIGFTKQIPQFFSACNLIVGKAGGLTTTETISSKLPSLIFDESLPLQEIYNKNFMIEKGCALPVSKKNLADKINFLLANPQEYEKMVLATEKTRKLYAIDKFYEVLKDVPKANYDGLKVADSKKEVIKKVRQQRKIDHKNLVEKFKKENKG